MNESIFWELIDQARAASNGDSRRQAELLVAALAQRSEDEILAFGTILDDLHDQAYDVALWEAAYLLGCGCSDDGFIDFRAWLIGQGKVTFERALADPESLADIVEVGQDTQIEGLQYVALIAYEERTGREEPPPHHRESPILKGKHAEDESAILQRFPKLADKFWKRCLEMYC